jgi:membrane fusion protein
MERLGTMQSEFSDTLKLQKADADTAREHLVALESSQEALHSQIYAMTRRVQAAEQTVTRYESLQKSGFVSDMQIQEKRDDLTDQQVKLSDLRKALTSQMADIMRARRELASMPLKDSVTRSQLLRNISAGEAELSKQKNDHEWSVIAPCDGVVASLTIASHQTAAISVPLITIIPTNTTLIAKLYASSHALGFLKPGQLVKIKLDAFPYQKFGFSPGKVVAISDSPVLASEISAGTRLGTLGSVTDSLYTIDVALERQFVDAYGKRQALRPGLQLQADIELDTRSLYEWVLEPLYSMRRN